MRIQENKLNNLSVLYICSKFVYSLFAVCFCNTFPVCVHCPCYVPVLDWIIFFLLCLLNKKRIKNNSNCTADRELHAGLHWADTLDWYAGGMPPNFFWVGYLSCLPCSCDCGTLSGLWNIVSTWHCRLCLYCGSHGVVTPYQRPPSSWLPYQNLLVLSQGV